MSASTQDLEGYSGNNIAYSLIIEGHNYAYATANVGSVYNSSPENDYSGTNPIGSMKLGGTLSASIKLYTPDIEPDTITVSVVDTDNRLIQALFREGNSSGHITFLTSSVTAGSTANIAVKSTTGFAASGAIYIGGETILYSGKTATTFTGITRGYGSINLTNGGTQFAPAHLIGNNVTASARTAPAVTDYVRTWYGRFCHLYLHTRDPLTGNYTTTGSGATKIFTGRIQSYEDEGNGTITITLKSASDLLYKQIGPDQWRGYVNAGDGFNSDRDLLEIYRFGTTAYGLWKQLGLSGSYTHEQIAQKINAQIVTNTWDSTWTSGAATIDAGDRWRLELIDTGDGGPPRYRMRANDSGGFAADNKLYFGAHPLVLSLLGFAEPGELPTIEASGRGIFSRIELHRSATDNSLFEVTARLPPIVYYFQTPSTQPSQTLRVTDEVNTFVTQSATDFLAWPDSNGVVQIKGGHYDGVYAVKYTNGSPSTIDIHAVLDRNTGYFQSVPTGRGSLAVRLGEDGASTPPEVRQVVFYRGGAGTLLLNLLLSTGNSGYNHATYDVLTTAGFGAGVPCSLIDVTSWEHLNDVQVALLIGEPKPFYELLEPVLAVSGRYVLWKASSATTNPKLTIVQPSLDSVVQSTWQMTESNKADPNERTKIGRAVDGLINRVVVKYGQGISGNADQAVTLTVDDLPSQTDYGRRRTVTINGGPVVNVPEIVSQTLSPIFTYFSRPVATAERSFNASLLRMAPGDSVTLTDNYAVNPKTGARGATLYAWCLDTRFDLATGKGRARLVYLPEKDPSYTGYWAPSARVDETAGGGGWSGDVTKILTLKPHEFSESTATLHDAQWFNVGDKVRVRQLDPATPAATITWVDTIAATPSADTRTLTTGSGGLFDATKRYVLEYDDINTVTSTQRQSAFLADASTLSTGFTPPTPYEWGSTNLFLVNGPTADYSTGVGRATNITQYTQGEPMSIDKMTYLAKGCNNVLSYRTRTVHLNEYLGDLSVTGTTDTLKFMAWVPFYGHYGSGGTRSIKVAIRGRQAGGGTATFTVASSPVAPKGTSYTSFSYPQGKTTTAITTTSATNVWSSEASMTPSVGRSGPGVGLGTWISVYAKGSGGGITATFNQISVYEKAL